MAKQATTEKTENAENSVITVSDTITVGGHTLRVKKRVSTPVLPFLDNMQLVCKFMDAIHLGKTITEGAKGKAKMETPQVSTIMSPTGEMRTLIVATVLEKELTEAYPSNEYVGCWFHIVKLPKREGKNYSNYVITEIDAPDETFADAQRQALLDAPSAPTGVSEATTAA